MDSNISKGTQCVHRDFSSYRGYGNLLAKRIHVRILGHAGWILRSYLHDLCDRDIQAFIAMTRLEDHNFVVSHVWLFQYPKSLGCFLQLVEIPPDGSELLILSSSFSITTEEFNISLLW
jgi:hypothetical protein